MVRTGALPATARAFVAAACVLVGCSFAALGGAAPAENRVAQVSYPSSIVVLGHSGATGLNSDPRRPGIDVRENSWATGTNPAVKSLYLRILAKNPKIRGHNHNLALDGATVTGLAAQASRISYLEPRPDLVVVQIMDNDIRCDGKDKAYLADFRRTFISALSTVRRAAPRSQIFVVSQLGRPRTWAKALTPGERKSFSGWPGPCDFLSSSGTIVPARLAYLEATIRGFEAQLASGCKRVAGCRYDNGAFGRVVVRHAYLSSDLGHPSVKGHAKAAAVAWAAMQRAGIIPSTG